jgi:hypothetical protein
MYNFIKETVLRRQDQIYRDEENIYLNFFREFNLFGGIRFWMELVFS